MGKISDVHGFCPWRIKLPSSEQLPIYFSSKSKLRSSTTISWVENHLIYDVKESLNKNQEIGHGMETTIIYKYIDYSYYKVLVI